MIRFENVTFAYRGKPPVLESWSLAIPDGARLSLFGASGIGKTTALRLLMGLERPRHGRVTGTEGLRFSAVFQENRLLSERTVLENAALFSDTETACRVLNRLGLADVLDSLPHQISGGQRRRAALGRALAHPFDVLVLDEALTGLDGESAERCLTAIDEITADKTLVLVSHDKSHAERLRAVAVELGSPAPHGEGSV
ncbi:MAG: ABC transporter ATP-binding protein [Oscillospiraceae bacterium]|nr:ABC transporter ATP-binding protein [Oscillospiraceae bacterium]